MRWHCREKVFGWLKKGWRPGEGFTLIELLVVIIVIAILAAIAIPTYLGQRAKAQDTAAYTLVRNGLTAAQSVCIDTGGYSGLTEALLNECEPTITFVEYDGGDLVDVDAPSIAAGFDADASDREVAFYNGESNDRVDLASRSESGNIFGIQIDRQDVSQIGYVEVKVVAGEGSELGW